MRPICKADGVGCCMSGEAVGSCGDERSETEWCVGYVGCTWVSISTRYVVEELERCYVANEDDSWSSDITNGSIAVTV